MTQKLETVNNSKSYIEYFLVKQTVFRRINLMSNCNNTIIFYLNPSQIWRYVYLKSKNELFVLALKQLLINLNLIVDNFEILVQFFLFTSKFICPFLILLWCDVYQMMPTKSYFVNDSLLIEFSKQMQILILKS